MPIYTHKSGINATFAVFYVDMFTNWCLSENIFSAKLPIFVPTLNTFT